jgi:hypothetical protein
MKPKLNLLVSYPYFTNDIYAQFKRIDSEDLRLYIDSGAFTAWKAGKEIKLDDYCKFIESLPIVPTRYFTLDVIGNYIKTEENYRIMLDRGFNPVPIFTRGEDVSMIDEYYKTSDLIAIGGLVGTLGNKGFVKGIMKVIGNRKCHWLGFCNLEFMKYYKPYSADSSSLEDGARYGHIRFYIGKGEFTSFSKGHPPAQIIRRCVRELGYDIDDLQKKRNWHGGTSINRILGARAAIAMAIAIEKNIGTFYFQAGSTSLIFRLLCDGFLDTFGGTDESSSDCLWWT